MDPSTRSRVRGGAARLAAVVGAGVLIVGALPAGAAATHDGPRTLQVGPGQEYAGIQDAVDAARSGDTIRIAPGNYREAVCVHGKGLTIRGAGAGVTNLVWPGWRTVRDLPAVPSTPCWEAQERADADGDPDTLADDVSALFFLDPDGPVLVGGLSTRNHPASGIVAWGADGFRVAGTSGSAHDRHGIAAFDSTGIRITDNSEVGLDRGTGAAPDSGTAGVAIGDSDRADATVSGNDVEGYDVGISLREARGGRVTGNALTGNCIGLLLVDDVATEVPDASRDVPSGGFGITGNTSTDNDRYCLRGREGDEHVSGVGMQVVDADDVTVAGNVIADNTADLPAGVPALTGPAGGLTLLTRPASGAGPLADVRVSTNYFGDNHALVPVGTPPPRSVLVDMDVFVGDPSVAPSLPPGGALEFRDNRCDTGLPPDICGEPYPV
ncbi:nitrous oxide reductase family maturation protein NosD [Geodermatophilus sp. SYSU D01045]